MFYNSGYTITINCNNNELKNIVSKYKSNWKEFGLKIEQRLVDEESLKHYFYKVSADHLKFTFLDKIEIDKNFREKCSNEAIKFIEFYNRIVLDEIELFNNMSDVENAINIMYANNSNLNYKLKELHEKIEYDFKMVNEKLESMSDISIRAKGEKKCEKSILFSQYI